MTNDTTEDVVKQKNLDLLPPYTKPGIANRNVAMPGYP